MHIAARTRPLRRKASPNEVTTREQYTDWMKGILVAFPDARYELRSFAIGEKRKSVVVYAVFHATHTGQGGQFRRRGNVRLMA